jgi:hypothetical protein
MLLIGRIDMEELLSQRLFAIRKSLFAKCKVRKANSGKRKLKGGCSEAAEPPV